MGAAAMLAALAVALVCTVPATAATTTCRLDGTGPLCHVWNGKVHSVGDGDTLRVDIAGDGTSVPVRVRLNGINAMELTRYSHTPSMRRGACHAVGAANRLDAMVRAGGKRVKVLAQDPRSRSGKRLRRAIRVRAGGRWIDPAQVLLREGWALWHPGRKEWAFNRPHQEGALQAASEGLRLWNPSACGARIASAVTPRLLLNWHTHWDGTPNGEWVRISNPSERVLHLGGWHLRDSSTTTFRFPSGAQVAPGAALTVYVGRGTPTATRLYWGLGKTIFQNPSMDHRWSGDGAYLLDPQGNLRAWMMYPAVRGLGGTSGPPQPH
jgi:micrococcal nuclease